MSLDIEGNLADPEFKSLWERWVEGLGKRLDGGGSMRDTLTIHTPPREGWRAVHRFKLTEVIHQAMYPELHEKDRFVFDCQYCDTCVHVERWRMELWFSGVNTLTTDALGSCSNGMHEPVSRHENVFRMWKDVQSHPRPT